MLKIVKTMLRGFASSDEFKDGVLAEYKYILDGIEPKVVEYCRVVLDEGDLLVLPESIPEDEFEKIVSMIHKDRQVGVIAADKISVIKVS